MNLVMCCTPINREKSYLDELRKPLMAALTFKRTYPEGQVYVATTPEAIIPKEYKAFFNVVRFDFAANPFALSRQMFYSSFSRGSHMTDDTVFAGCDVLWGNKPFPRPDHKMMLSYRCHPAQPYCSDLVFVRKGEGEFSARFHDMLVKMISFLPRKVRLFWADQVALTIALGKFGDDEFDGLNHIAPRYPDILLVPGDDYLFTPNDLFCSTRESETNFSRYRKDVTTPEQLMRLMYQKYAIHFKGPRKDWMFALAYMVWRKGWIDPYQCGLDADPKELFKGAFVTEEKAAA